MLLLRSRPAVVARSGIVSTAADRDANSSIHLIVVNRLRWHEPTRRYLARRTQEGKTKKENHPLFQTRGGPRALSALPVLECIDLLDEVAAVQ